MAASASDHRRDAADLKQDRPAIMRNERRADEAGQRAAHRHAADGDDRQRRAQPARRRFGVDRNEVGNDAADAEAGEKPQPEQLRQIGRIGGRKRQHAEQKVGDDQRRLAAVAVADKAHELRAEQHADIAGGEHPFEVARRHMPVGDEMGRGKRNRADVVAVDDPDQNRPYEHPDLERTRAPARPTDAKLEFPVRRPLFLPERKMPVTSCPWRQGRLMPPR